MTPKTFLCWSDHAVQSHGFVFLSFDTKVYSGFIRLIPRSDTVNTIQVAMASKSGHVSRENCSIAGVILQYSFVVQLRVRLTLYCRFSSTLEQPFCPGFLEVVVLRSIERVLSTTDNSLGTMTASSISTLTVD